MRRKVKSCSRCKYLLGFPYIHCELQIETKLIKVAVNEVKFIPKDFDLCTKKRNEIEATP